MQSFDYIIVGSGLAGLSAAYYASKHGSVALITKTTIDISSSYNAQGGVAAVVDPNDSFENHIKDTLVAGRGLCEDEPVRILVEEGVDRIKDLIGLGMKFDTVDGEISLGLEGGHSFRRILHAGGDASGRKLSTFVHSLVKSCKSISIFEGVSVQELAVKNGCCYGVHCFDHKNNIGVNFKSKHTILATGGLSAIYSRTTNPESSKGDGIALAYNAGCEMSDLEFIQFHPTSFYSEVEKPFLISEAVRGEGAQLLNSRGERFMDGVHELKELAPRDVVAYNIFKQIKETAHPCVYLSLSHLDKEHIKRRFPTIYDHCKHKGVDMTEKIPVAPAAHYTIGGIRTDVNGATNIKNLFACGEVASVGIMGSNRLASNSLLECLVYSYRSVQYSLNVDYDICNIEEYHYSIDEKYRQKYLDINADIAKLLNSKAGIVRDEKELLAACEYVENIKSELLSEKEFYNSMLNKLCDLALLIIKGAIARQESRGCHFRADYPNIKESFRKHTIQKKTKNIELLALT